MLAGFYDYYFYTEVYFLFCCPITCAELGGTAPMLLNRCGSLETVLSSFHAVCRAVTSCDRDGVFASANIVCDPLTSQGRLLLLCTGCCFCWSFLYSAVLCSWAGSLRLHVILHEWIAFYSAFLNIHRSGVLTVLAWLVPHETAAISVCSAYTMQLCTMSLHAKPPT